MEERPDILRKENIFNGYVFYKVDITGDEFIVNKIEVEGSSFGNTMGEDAKIKKPATSSKR